LVQGSGRFVWPLRGDVVTRFGSQPGGVTIDGVEIAGRAGASVTAAADGDVFYANQELEGYGVVILIRHADNYVTAYGHNRRALVREGDRVRAGQQIAELGERPDGRSRLLFQVRRGTSAVDPMPLLGPRGD
jgi:lipoprotein NlpD